MVTIKRIKVTTKVKTYLDVENSLIEEEKEEVEFEVSKAPDQIHTSEAHEDHVCSS